MRFSHAEHTVFLLLAGGLFILATAWGFQLIGGYIPCKLCLQQRNPYYIGLPLAAVALFLLHNSRGKAAQILLLVICAIFIYGACLGAYQAGAEWQFWNGPNDCGGGTKLGNASDMLSTLKNTRVVSCTEASWRMLGLSFAGWNVLASLGLALLAIGAILLDRKARTK